MNLNNQFLGALQAKEENRPIWQFFNQRYQSIPQVLKNIPHEIFSGGKAIDLIHDLLVQQPVNDRILKIIIPFCNENCTYFSGKKKDLQKPREAETYLQVLESRFKNISETIWFSSAPFHALVFGGGSPSSLPVPILQEYIQLVKKYLWIDNECEISVQVLSDEVNADLMNMLKEEGVNRISFPIYTFNEKTHLRLHHSFSKKTALDAIESTYKSGIKNINLDLYYNLPGQTMDNWANDLELLSTSGATSCMIRSHIYADTADMDNKRLLQKEYEFHHLADEYLLQIDDWRAFSTLNYGHFKSGRFEFHIMENCFYDILGFGPGIGSRINNNLIINSEGYDTFLRSNDFVNNYKQLIQLHPLFNKYNTSYKLASNLHIDELVICKMHHKFNANINLLVKLGFAERSKGNISLTADGRFWAANIAALFSDTMTEIMAKK